MRHHDITRDIIVWIENNKNSNLKISKIAEKAGFSKWYMQKFFKERAEITIATYCRLRRLSAAAISLRLTGASIKEISSNFGFDSPATFATSFRRQFGITPAAFRVLNEWPFDKMLPRLDFDLQIEEVKPCIIKEPKWKIITKSDNVNDLNYLINNDSVNCFYINIEKGKSIYHKNEDVPINFSLCSSEKENDKEEEWLSVSLSSPVTELEKVTKFIYAGLLPTYGIIRRRGPDCIKVNKNDSNEVIITEYKIPCSRVEF
ncbi:MAG: helix-turn-helix domain-containing protein [Mixta sp.]